MSDNAGRFKKGCGGRPKGSLNKSTRALKETALAALEKAGGIEYLARVAETDPKAFCSLLCRVLPSDLSTKLTHEAALALMARKDVQWYMRYMKELAGEATDSDPAVPSWLGKDAK